VTPSARLAAAIVLLDEVATAPRRPADAVANDFFRARRYIGSSDRRAVSERAWAVLRARRRLGWWLDWAQLPQTPRLLVAASLLVEGMTMPQLVQAFSGGQYAPSALARADADMLQALVGRTLDFKAQPLPVRLEIPDWIMPRLAARFGGALEPEMRAALGPAPLDLRVNLLKATRDEARAALAAEGIEAEPTPYSPWGLRVAGRRAVTTGAAFREGLVEIQDEGSQLVALLVGAAPGMRVADWCAGAGGKTLALAMTMENHGQVLACDVSAPRLDGAVRRLRRAGVHNAERHLVQPGDKWAKRRAGSFDRVLVDAPCTGTGTWRRNPDARTRLGEQDLRELLDKQAVILDDAARLVKPGGRMIYATCSVLAEEDEDQVGAFLARQPSFTLLRAALPGNLTADPYLVLTPRRHGTDGFFAAVLERGA
jgi:16S rRNA (cytosine967-C5)-methyltransferase